MRFPSLPTSAFIAAAAGLLLLAGGASAAPAMGAKATAVPSFSDCKGCPEMVTVPAGKFVMGSPADEKYRGSEDQHTVTIAKPFAVSRFEITFDQWRACVADKGCPAQDEDEGWGRGRRPVIHVQWNDAHAYAAWLSRKTGKHYRLLTEAEWEYAARAGTTTPFAFGPTLSSAQANFDASTRTDMNPKGLNRQKTMPVGSFAPNAFGLYDMHGNAWEWVQDCWNDEYVGAPADGSAWETGICSGKVLRGGSWEDSVTDIRVGARVSSLVEEASWSDSIRVARDLP